MSVTDELLRNAERYAESFDKGDLPLPPGKKVAVVACMDARLIPTRVLGLEEGDFGGGYIGFGSGQAQVVFAPPGVEPVLPDMGVDLDSRDAVDAAHAEAVRAGHEVIYGPVDESWGVRRFFVRDPHGVVISVLAHE